ncbi:hypothetical protein F5887DRAFT_1013242 [Amanita rubescens]|nr:hypothetical protein F5887DRAFT_1013242 [Amanita rubescens]
MAYSSYMVCFGRGHTLMDPQGPVWVGICDSLNSISASEYHPQLAAGSADGTCATTNTLRTTRRGGSVPFFVHKIYQMDYSRNTGEFRMLEHFLPQVMFQRCRCDWSLNDTLDDRKCKTDLVLLRHPGRRRIPSLFPLVGPVFGHGK